MASAPHSIAAEILETSASGYAAAALTLLQESDGAANRDGTAWKAHLFQRVLELAAAVRVQQPALFARRIAWLRRAALARGADEQALRGALLSLRAALQRELPEHLLHTVAPALDLAVSKFDDALAPEHRVLDAAKPVDRVALQYLAACLDGQPQAAIDLVLRELDNGLAPAVVYAQVLVAAQKEIGQLWHVGDASIAEEHLVTETTRELMALIVAKHAPATGNGHSLIAAAVAGNAHDLGLRAVADLFRLAGWRCLFLGANVPAAEIARAAESFDVDLVVLNATLTTQLKPLGEAIDALRSSSPRRKILVGGLAFDDAPALWQSIGADAYAESVQTAESVGRSLLAKPQ
jgi:methanogenic corrinoid protein MtbC1